MAEKRNPAGGAGLLCETTEGPGALGMAVYSPPECSLVAIGLGQVQNCFHVTLARGRSTVFPGLPQSGRKLPLS